MKRITLLMILVVFSLCFAEIQVDQGANEWRVYQQGASRNLYFSIENGNVRVGSANTTADLNVSEDVIVVGDVTVGDDLTVTSDASVGGDFTLTGDTDIGGKLDVDQAPDGGASVGNIVKITQQSGETYTTTTAGLSIKNYDADTTVVHSGGENTGLYVNVKMLSEMAAGGEASLISAHEHSSSTGTFKYGMILYGSPTNSIGISGGTSTNIINTDNQTATNFISTADGAGGATVGVTDITGDLTADAYLRVKIGDNYYKILLWQYSP